MKEEKEGSSSQLTKPKYAVKQRDKKEVKSWQFPFSTNQKEGSTRPLTVFFLFKEQRDKKKWQFPFSV